MILVRFGVVAAAGACFLLLAAFLLQHLGTSLIEADEAAHYVNALMIGDWIAAGLPHPLHYAQDYYAHFPRVSIGHWPPAWYMLEAPAFALLRPSPAAIVIFTTMVGGCNAALVDWALCRAGHRRIAPVAALTYLLLPLTLEQTGYILLDQPLTLACGLSAMAWWWAVRRPGLLRYLLFAFSAALALMIKGNGAMMLALPLIHIALTRRWVLLANWRLWVAAIVGLLLVAPWYWVTFQISKGGFNYEPGPAYAWMALVFAKTVLIDNLTPMGAGLTSGGLLLLIFHRHAVVASDREKDITILSGAMALACLLIFLTIPVSLVSRYLAPMLPWLVVLITLLILQLWRQPSRAGRLMAGACATFFLANAFWPDKDIPLKVDIGGKAIAERIAARPGLWMVDGRATGEGGVIASAAYRDGGAMQSWTLRATQWLSSSDFMGRGYVQTIRDPAEVRALLDRLGVVGVISVREHHKPAYPHSSLLTRSIDRQAFTVEKHGFLRGDGHYLIAVRRGAIVPHPELIETKSNNVRALSASVD